MVYILLNYVYRKIGRLIIKNWKYVLINSPGEQCWNECLDSFKRSLPIETNSSEQGAKWSDSLIITITSSFTPSYFI